MVRERVRHRGQSWWLPPVAFGAGDGVGADGWAAVLLADVNRRKEVARRICYTNVKRL